MSRPYGGRRSAACIATLVLGALLVVPAHARGQESGRADDTSGAQGALRRLATLEQVMALPTAEPGAPRPGTRPESWGVELAGVRHSDVFPGIELAYFYEAARLEAALVVAPGADLAGIALAFPGLETVGLNADGALVVGSAGLQSTFARPSVRRVVDGEVTPLAAGWTRRRADTIGVWTGTERDPAATLLVHFEASLLEPATGPVVTPLVVTLGAPPMVDALVGDADMDGQADAGDTIRYTTTVTNNGDEPAQSMQMDATLDVNTALVNGSLNISPLAIDDAYDGAIGHVTFNVDAAGGVLSNDRDPPMGDCSACTITTTGSLTSFEGGAVQLNADGSFTYEPPVGFSGTDTFTYTVQDAHATTPLDNSATVSIMVDDLVWFVDSSAAATGDGRQATPFQTLAEVEASSGAGHIIRVRQGDSGTTPYAGGIVLKDQQQLIGGGVDLVVGTTTVETADGDAVITNASGHVVTLAADNAITGVELQPVASAGIFGTGALGAAAVDATTVAINGATSDGIFLQNTTGSFAFANGTVSTSVTGTGVAVRIDGGSPTVTFANSPVSKSGGLALDVLNTTGGALTFTGGSVTGTGGAGVRVMTAAGNVTLGATTPLSVTTATGDAVSLQSNTGTTSLSLVTLTTTGPGNRGIFASNAGMVNVTDGTSQIASTGGPAVDIDNTTLGMTFTSVSSGNSNAAGIDLDSVNGSFTAAGGLVTGSTGVGVDINGGSGTITYAGGITNTSATTRGIEITNLSGGAVMLSGAVDEDGLGVLLTGNAGAAINLTGNLDIDTGANAGFTATGGGTVNVTGASKAITTTTANAINLSGTNVNFTNGGLDVDTTSGGTGFNATGGGTVTVSGGGNTVDTSSGTGTGVSISNATIGAAGVTFQSISVSGAPSGIVLNTTGPTGAFVVTGDGMLARNASGGTLTGTTNDAVSLVDANNVTLQQMQITSCGNGSAGDDCIDVLRGNGVTLSAVHVQGATGTGANEDFGNGLRLTDVGGTTRIDNDSLFTGFPGASTRALRMRNTDTDGALVLDDSSFTQQGTTNSATYVTVQSFGTANITFTVTNDCQFTGLRGDAILSAAGEQPGSTGTVTTVIENSDFLDAAANGSGAIAMTVSQTGATQDFVVRDNVFRNLSTTLAAPVGIITANVANGGGTLSGQILRNTIDPNSGTRRGIQVVGQTTSSSSIVGTLNVTIDDNSIDRIPATFAILTDVDDGIDTATINITNNRIGTLAGSEGQIGDEFDGALLMRVRGTPAATVDTTISNNTIRANVPSGGRIMFIDARDSRTANFDILDNLIQNDAATAPDPEFFNRVLGALNVVCLNLKGNNAVHGSAGGMGSGDFDLNVGSGTVTVEGLATVTTDNAGTFAIEAGIANASNCIQ